MNRSEWLQRTESEKLFWQNWFEKKGWHWPTDFEFRFNKNTEIQPEIAAFLKTGNECILDVGCGPITMLGRNFNGQPLNITCTDILADDYNEMFEKAGVEIDNKPIKVAAEELSAYFTGKKFDIVHAQNCIDHCFDPYKAIREMLKVLKKSGVIYMRHEVCEAINENYTGLHQWNFEIRKGRFAIWNNDVKKYVDDEIKGISIESIVEGGYITNIIRKR